MILEVVFDYESVHDEFNAAFSKVRIYLDDLLVVTFNGKTQAGGFTSIGRLKAEGFVVCFKHMNPGAIVRYRQMIGHTEV